MDEKHFDESLKKILENAPSFEVDEQAIADMRHRLDEAERRKRSGVGWPWWLAALIALPFLITSIFFYLKLQKYQDQVNGETLHLTQRIDTIIEKHVVYHFDTIYTKVYREMILEPEYVSRNDLGIGQMDRTLGFWDIGKLRTGPAGLYDRTKSELWQEWNYFNNNPLLNWRKEANSGNATESSEELDWSQLTAIGGLPLKPLQLPREYYWNKGVENDWPKPDSTQTKRKINPVYYFMPTGFDLAVHGSPINFVKLPNKSINGFGYGVAGAIQFGKKVRMRLGAELLKLDFELKNDSDFTIFPSIDPENPNDELKELYGKVNYLQIPLSFQYYFRPEKSLRPYLDVGMIASRPTNQSLRYEFIGTGGEYYLSQSFDNTAFSINNLRTALGFEVLLWKNFYGNVEGFYHYNFEQPEETLLQLRYWGLDLGMKYKF